MKTITAKQRLSALQRIHRALDKRFSAPAWALLHEVSNSTGFSHKRNADAVAMSLWPSRGLEVHGVEVKVHRSDWLRELKKPEKSAPVQVYCDRWWIAAPSTDVVQVDELPKRWGLLVLRGQRGLVAVKQAPELEPEPLDRGFVAAMGRRMNENVTHAVRRARAELESDDTYQHGYKAGQAAAAVDAPFELDRWKRAHAHLLKDIERFEEASGVKISGYNGHRLGEAVALILQHRHQDPVAALQRQEDQLKTVMLAIQAQREAIEMVRSQGAAT